MISFEPIVEMRMRDREQTNEQTSDFIDTRASIDQNVTATLLNNPTEELPLATAAVSIPLTTILPPKKETRTEIWISRIPKTPSVTEADYESQV